ncbi:ABC transporter permease [Pseudalkalibacillus caeni]|uniref:ABC transporter permease n=1 Tax=Exobacillus caeni TaxID=2574798 RepID=A0A5R9FD15_9BACL|nr:ABC transporter permease [Pseudalkalibacillus caeni]TLS37555.1 ABC transporter permease [Pseudalkalibacillus caeni]
MGQWFILFKKECMESWRNYKWLWMPSVFLILGLMQPITTYYLPDILATAGELPEGSEISIPIPPAPDVIAATFGQFSQIGILVLVLASMGIVAGERASGTASMILARPVSRFSFISAKWAAMLLLTWLSYLVGYAGSWYYTFLLIGEVEATNAIGAFFVYGLWLTFAVTLTVFFSTILKNAGIVAFLSIGSLLVISALSHTLTKLLAWSPGRLSVHASSIVSTGEGADHFFLALSVSIGIIIVLLILAYYLFKQKELVE